METPADSGAVTVGMEDVTAVENFIAGVCPFLLGASQDDITSALRSPDATYKLKKFASDPKNPVLFINLATPSEDDEAQEPEAAESPEAKPTISIELEVSFVNEKSTSVAIIKTQPDAVFDGGKDFIGQLQVIKLNGSPFDSLHAFLHHSLNPFFRSFMKASKKSDKDPKGIVEKKMAELELTLYNCKQNVQIEQVKLSFHPDIVQAAKKDAGRTLRVEDLGEHATETHFLNSLQAMVNVWIRNIQKVTKHERIETMPALSETLQEIKFWIELEGVLQSITDQLETPEAQCTLNALKQAKRFHATAAFDTDTIGLKKAKEVVAQYKPIMKDFPIDDLLTAAEVNKISDAVKAIFTHLKRTKNAYYPINRYLQLVEAISRDLCSKVLSILRTKRLMHMSYADFERLTGDCKQVFAVWEDEFESFRDSIREIAKKRNKEKIPLKINAENRQLQERLDEVRKFRQQHEELHGVVSRVLPSGGSAASGSASGINPSKEIHEAYQLVIQLDVLDLSPEGAEAWRAGVKKYEGRIDRVETHITDQLCDRLATAKNASEMFRVFSKFNALFFRPRVREAIQLYQAQLIERVKDDIKVLHHKFKQQYSNSEASYMAQLRDLPPVAGAIIWATQIERQLAAEMKRVEDILGKGWEVDVQGQKLKADGERFRRKLNTSVIFEEWVKDVESRNFQISGRLLDVNRKGTKLNLDVHFDPQIITLFKEVRNLQALNFRVPLQIILLASSAKQVYPFAVSLKESVRTFVQSCARVGGDVAPLVAAYKKDVQSLLNEGFHSKWEAGSKLEPYVRRLADAVATLRDKVDELLTKHEKIVQCMEQLATCPIHGPALQRVASKLQEAVDELNLAGYSNLDAWVRRLDKQLEAVLTERLLHALDAWLSTFAADSALTGGSGSGSSAISEGDAAGHGLEVVTSSSSSGAAETAAAAAPRHRPQIRTSVHEVLIRNQMMHLQPPLHHARQTFLQQLSGYLGTICDLPRLQSSRYDASLSHKKDAERAPPPTYRHLLARLPEGALRRVYEAIEERLRQVSEYVDIWLQYQALWDMEASAVFSRLGDDLSLWQRLLEEIKRSRRTFDNSESEKRFGPVVVVYGQVQSSVSHKYDLWHKDILQRFASRMSDAMRTYYATISGARMELERHQVDGSESTADAVVFILRVQEMRKNLSAWGDELRTYANGQELLRRQRYSFPADWLEYDMVDGEWHVFNEILQRKTDALNAQIPSLQMKVASEAKLLDERIRQLADDWAAQRPVSGDTRHSAALDTLRIFEGRVTRLKEEHARITAAKQALDLAPSGGEDHLATVEEEMRDLKEVWSKLAQVWASLDQLKETPWSAVLPRKVRQALDDILATLKTLPNRVRQYSAFEHLQSTVKDYLRANAVISDLHSEAIKERHWKELRRKLNAQWLLNELTLGDLWASDVNRHANLYKEVIQRAQGELALEEFLKQVRQYWETAEVDLVNYQNKVRLIRGWDDLFAKLAEHSNSLGAMRMSPYFKVFEEESTGWEDKLSRLQALFDVWMDVQRRWVYLEGIFSGSGDIQHLLPQESSRFRAINTEFVALHKKVAAAPRVLDVLHIEGIHRQMERLADLLAKIQKALGEYLERQRSAFPRFYFVGDEDLLEIIGNSRDIVKIQKHLRKMFAGLASLVLDESQTEILGMASREGETVMFKRVVSLKDHPKIYEWLAQVENEMKYTLAAATADVLEQMRALAPAGPSLDVPAYLAWIDRCPAQLLLIATQIGWTQQVEEALAAGPSGAAQALEAVVADVEAKLSHLADAVLQDIPPMKRSKLEYLITECVHQRDVTRQLVADRVASAADFAWLYQMRFYWDESADTFLKKVVIRMADASFAYGWEYLGVAERLVQTPLTDRCYLTLTQALESRMGGSPFGPAGTGKTETVKALGQQLGRFVIVFCCDENFDFQAMGRIFVGLCQCGAWGCFDEFNRLEERILSAVSQQIQAIQLALKEGAKEVDIIGKAVKVNQSMGVFVTMNPGYAGRSNLPDNLKQLFRGVAMIQPDRELIAQVMLYSQGYRTAERLASKVVPLFKLCDEQLSSQSHYDFGLRALKSVLVSAGNIKRQTPTPEALDEGGIEGFEQEILLRSIWETVTPKLVASDVPLFTGLLSDVFPKVAVVATEMAMLRGHIDAICRERHLVAAPQWIDKLVQLYQVLLLRHGCMMVGPSGSGKTASWAVLQKALERMDGIETKAYVLDPKAITKDSLFGTLDATTREWTDGLFTALLRKIVDNLRGEASKRHWIIFDGDVDPEWVENLNSLLDDNKLLTLPNGERLALPNNVRVMFEVQDLKYATLATVSRCGMVWFSEETLTTQMLFARYLTRLREEPFDEQERDQLLRRRGAVAADAPKDEFVPPGLQVQRQAADVLVPLLAEDGLVERCLTWVANRDTHIMDLIRLRVIEAMFSLVNKGVMNIIEYNQNHSDFVLPADVADRYVANRLCFAIMWGFGGSMPLVERQALGAYLAGQTTLAMPPLNEQLSLLDYWPSVEDGEWKPWTVRVPQVEVESHLVASPDVVIPTVDTVRHEDALKAWLAEHRPVVLCGPPGSGKTMTLMSSLKALPDLELVSLNFSSATTPELLLKTFDQHCEYKRTQEGTVLQPTAMGKWLVIFCDECNLPAADKYGTQRVITFLRQLVEQNGFWRTSDHQWITLHRIQFVGACNPPTDAGRVPLTHRFLRHVPLLLVDFPSAESLRQIYGTFYRALLKLQPALRGHAAALTEAMVEFYLASQRRFVPDMQAHYIYSPRELSRWMRALLEALKQVENIALEDLMRLWVHEGLRLFQDRLVTRDEARWTDEAIDGIVLKHFPNLDQRCLERPILFSNWLSKEYVRVEREALRDHVKARLKVFYEEELDVPLVVFDEVLDHILRIDRVLRQPQGHALLIGVSGGGKTVLSRFVAWMNGQSIFTIKVNNRYTAEDFDDDLRHVMKRAGCNDERICFIFDESNVLDSAFLERMNTLLASGEVPGLFEGDDWTALMHACREAVQRNGLLADTEDEMYKWFTLQVRRNLHIIFTMNPASPDFHNRSATSPALFNRCVLDWFGEWSPSALFQVGSEFTQNVDLDDPAYRAPDLLLPDLADLPLASPVSGGAGALSHREAVVAALVYIHSTINEANMLLHRQSGRSNYVTPRHYLDFISHLVHLVGEKREELEEQQLHVNVGLQKLRDTQQQVAELQKSLQEKSKVLEAKQAEANEKLAQMVQDQQVAEQKRAAAQELSKQMEKQTAEIQVKKARAYADLEKAEPAVEEAKNAVSGIKKEHLEEIRALARPPDKVKKTLEAVSILLHHKKLDWNGIRKLLMDRAFIPSIVQFDSNAISAKDRQAIQAEYLTDKEFNFESVNRASKACGPLVSWITAQISYSDILNRIQPLRQEVADLEAAANDLARKQDELQTTITELERSIARYKDEYAALISQAQAIKTEMATVSAKVDRSIALLSNLSSERVRWEASSAAFKAAMATVVGDSILAAAFVAYIGVFDQRYRAMLLAKWKTRLMDLGLTFKDDLSVVEYLSDSDRRLAWHANSLPADELCVENAIMLERFNRYPLVIDPSGQASEFLMQQYRDRKIKKTSFLDSAFMKNLESALRFGTPLLVEDVESIDPVLNPVLNKEIRKTGGRILIRLGDQDVDFSPSFVIFLSTRDPNAHFTPDLCSRVTFVNFTVTPGSLQEQCLHEVLKVERPDIHQKRVDLMRLQGEFKVRLRNLEKALLEALNESQGSILDNDHVIATLERLKTEAGEINQKMRETENVMEEISAVSSEYNPLALACSSIYFALEQAASIHFLYQFSLRFFLALFRAVLHDNPRLAGVKASADRLAILTADMFSIAFQRVARTLLHEDQLPFALRLLQIRLRDAPAALQLDPLELDYVLKGADVTVTAAISVPPALAPLLLSGGGTAAAPLLTEGQAKYLAELEKALPASFAGVVDHVAAHPDQWRLFFEDANAERAVPASWWDAAVRSAKGDLSESARLFRTLVLAKGLRPDRIIASGTAIVQALFSADFIHLPELDLGMVVEREAGPSTPLVLCSMPGYDASYKVDDLAGKAKKPYKSLAIGSAEGFDLAEKAIQAGAKAGTWVLLKNVHLAPQWLVHLEKKLHALEAKPGFRLFLTSEVHPALPGALLRMSRVLVFEPPPGVRANLEHILAAIPAERMAKAPIERSRLHFIMAWLHAVVQERLRYAPLGWSKTFEFNESDMRCALDTIDTWVDVAAHGRSNLPPERIPWTALKTLLAQTVYGGRIDNPFDQRLVESFLDYLFRPQAFDEGFALTPSLAPADQLVAPEAKSRDEFARWVREVIPKRETPGWLGLPENAEMMLLVEAGRRTLARLLKLQSMEDDAGLLPASIAAAAAAEADADEAAAKSSDPRPAWIQALHASTDKWLLLLPAAKSPAAVPEASVVSEERQQDPLYRCFDREMRAGRSLVAKVRHDLGQVIQACKGEIKQTNYLRRLITDLSKGVVPQDWRRYAIPESVGVSAWLVDLAERLQQLERLSSEMLRSPRPTLTVWLGGLFLPEAFITATRQAAARAHSWSLEHLELHLLPSAAAAAAEPDAFVLQGLTLEGGAGWRDDRLAIVPQLFTPLPDTAFVWRHSPDLKQQQQDDKQGVVNVPVYINGKRTEFLFDVDMPSPPDVAPSVWYQRGLALTAWARDRA